jgi:hypothetical protein
VSISETTSENRRRGRPRSYNREYLDGLPGSLKPTGGTVRTQLAKVNEYHVIGLIDELLEPDDQRVFLGGSPSELMAGKANCTPRGFCSFAIEFGRWADASSADLETLREHLLEVATAVRSGRIKFGDAAAHYRKNRLGSRAGNARSLGRHLARALDDYLRRFPDTKSETIKAALGHLVDANARVMQESAT